MNLKLTEMNKQGVNSAVLKGLVVLALAGAGPAFAVPLVFDRGLPTAYLNNAAGSNRSNINWADSENTNAPTEYWLPGDDFTLGGSGTYAVSTIRVWTTGDTTTGLTLFGGTGGSISAVSSTYAATSVTYGNSETYQSGTGSTGPYHTLNQVDFTVAFSLAAGTTYEFFVDGPWSTYSGGGYANTFLHGSNAAKSGSTQDGADDYFKWYHVGGSGGPAVETWMSGTGGGTTGWGKGWDKDSDANVQVFATVVPEPEAYGLALAGLAVVGVFGVRRRRA